MDDNLGVENSLKELRCSCGQEWEVVEHFEMLNFVTQPPAPVKTGQKKMATMCSRKFHESLGPPQGQISGSSTVSCNICNVKKVIHFQTFQMTMIDTASKIK